MGGILGAFLFICVAALFFVLGRKTQHARSTSTEVPGPLKESGIEVKSSELGGRLEEQSTDQEIESGGRLRYPTDSDVGGRLGTLS